MREDRRITIRLHPCGQRPHHGIFIRRVDVAIDHNNKFDVVVQPYQELRRLLRLDPDATEFKLAFGATAANDKEMAVLTRSILHLMQTMAAQVEVPAKDLTEHCAAPGWESVPGMDREQRMVEIRSSKDAPANAYVSVSYNGYWFWIDKHDLKSKRVFASMMLLFTLADSGEKEALPLITIPAQ